MELPGLPKNRICSYGAAWPSLGTESVHMELPGLPRNRICSYGAARAQQYQKTKEPKKPKNQRTKKNKKTKNHKKPKKQSFPIYVARCSLGWLSRGLGFGFARGAPVQYLGSTWGVPGPTWAHLWSTCGVPGEYLENT